MQTDQKCSSKTVISANKVHANCTSTKLKNSHTKTNRRKNTGDIKYTKLQIWKCHLSMCMYISRVNRHTTVILDTFKDTGVHHTHYVNKCFQGDFKCHI